jgi:pyruvate dehydrogenase E2 component (dihydrolipoyllysine-residue acetyltransferase)
MTQSASTIPHFYVSIDVDISEAEAWRRATNAQRGTHLTVTDVVTKGAAVTLRRFPRLNAHVGCDAITLKAEIHVGIAVAVDDGLLVPVIPGADQLSLSALSVLSRANAEAARGGRLTAGAVSTFTVTSLGKYGVRQFLPIINAPECAILAIGAVEPRVVPLPEGPAVRQVVTLTLACDHRAVDGAEAAEFLAALRSALEAAPATLTLWMEP